MPPTVMVRARPETRDALRELAESQGLTAVEALDRVVASYRDRLLLDALATVPAPDGAEVETWDPTLMDGLDASDDFEAWR